jgi:hypothetical protein
MQMDLSDQLLLIAVSGNIYAGGTFFNSSGTDM